MKRICTRLFVVNLFVLLSISLLFAGTENKATLVTRERYIGEYQPEVMNISPDYRHMGCIMERSGKKMAVIDGKEGTLYDQVFGRVAFSPDSKHNAYVAQQGDKQFVVLDGKEGKRYDAVGLISFSPDSSTLAYLARRNGKYLVVVGESEGKEYSQIDYRKPFFSPDGKRHAYGAKRGSKWLIVADGKEGPECDAPDWTCNWYLFSSNSKHVAYYGIYDKKKSYVVDGVQGPQYDELGSFSFSADGEHFAYAARRGDKWVVISDGQESKEYDKIDVYTGFFAKSGNRFAYIAVRDGKHFMVIDGKEEAQYDYIPRFEFSPDGKRLAYLANSGRKQLFIVDGQEQGRTEHSANVRGPEFSPDSKHVFFWVSGSNYAGFFVMDGKVQDESIYQVVFSPNGMRRAERGSRKYFEFNKSDKPDKPKPFPYEYFVILDGKEEPYRPSLYYEFCFSFSHDGKHYAYVASVASTKKEKQTVAVVVDGKMGKPFDTILPIEGPVFTSDSKHIVYIGMRDDLLCYIVLGEKESKGYLLVEKRLILEGNTVRAVALKDDKVYSVELEIRNGQ